MTDGSGREVEWNERHARMPSAIQSHTQFLFRPLDKIKSKRRQREPEVVYELIGARERYEPASAVHSLASLVSLTRRTTWDAAVCGGASSVSETVEVLVRQYTKAFHLYHMNLLDEALIAYGRVARPCGAHAVSSADAHPRATACRRVPRRTASTSSGPPT